MRGTYVALVAALLMGGAAFAFDGDIDLSTGDGIVVDTDVWSVINPDVEPDDYVFTLYDAENDVVIAVKGDGRVIYSGTPDKASEAFWENVGNHAPCAVKGE